RLAQVAGPLGRRRDDGRRVRGGDTGCGVVGGQRVEDHRRREVRLEGEVLTDVAPLGEDDLGQLLTGDPVLGQVPVGQECEGGAVVGEGRRRRERGVGAAATGGAVGAGGRARAGAEQRRRAGAAALGRLLQL